MSFFNDLSILMQEKGIKELSEIDAYVKEVLGDNNSDNTNADNDKHGLSNSEFDEGE